MKIFDEYVYINLKKYGNTLISEREYIMYGKETILNHLKENGYDCEIKIYKHKDIGDLHANYDIILEIL